MAAAPIHRGSRSPQQPDGTTLPKKLAGLAANQQVIRTQPALIAIDVIPIHDTVLASMESLR
jgi:hypothetical protein